MFKTRSRCVSKRLLKATIHHGRETACDVWINNDRLSTACGPPAQLRFLPATARSYTKAVITALVSRRLNCSWVLPREIPIVIDQKLTVFVQEHGTDQTFSKYCWYVSLTLTTSSLAFPPVRWNVVTVMEHVYFQPRCLTHWDHFLGYCATHKQPRLFCLRLQESVEPTFFSVNAESIINNSAFPWQSAVVNILALIVPGWNSRARSKQIPL